jgi:hypothetical protein
MSHRMKFAVWLVAPVLFSLCPLLAYGQYGDAQTDQSAMGQNNMGDKATSITGCIKQGQETGGYYLTTSDGKVYELTGKADISKHVNHTVTVTGHERMMSKSEEAKMEPNEKAEAGSKPYADMHVTGLKMVSDSCSQ